MYCTMYIEDMTLHTSLVYMYPLFYLFPFTVIGCVSPRSDLSSTLSCNTLKKEEVITKPPFLGRALFNPPRQLGARPFQSVRQLGARPFQSS